MGRVVITTLVVLVVLLGTTISFTIGWQPFVGPRTRALTSRTFEVTPQRLERGRYIFTALSGCIDCHSQHDMGRFGAPVTAGTEGAGAVMPFEGLPGRVVASNITPDVETGAGKWTDDQLARAIREGIGHDGRTLFPMMPYPHYRDMSDEDLASVVVYLRSLPPVRRELPKTEIIFPVKYLMRSAPEPVTAPVIAPDAKDQLHYGAYLIDIAGCSDCHTPMEKGQPIPGLEFAGGQVFKLPAEEVASANLTPDPSGIPYYTDVLFIQALRTGYVGARKLSPIMPFEVYKNLTDDDLKAIFANLRTLKAVWHQVDNAEAPTYCKLCRAKHGAGNQN